MSGSTKENPMDSNDGLSLIGVGLYTFPEASELTQIPSRDLRRWLKGYSSGAECVWHEPLWQSELAATDMDGIGFHDLLEARFVREFRKYGISLQAIRHASEYARDLFRHAYPFTNRRFQTDGRTIFLSALNETGETRLLDLTKKQYAFEQIIRPALYKDIEFGVDELAMRWYPVPRSKGIALDPNVLFGKPFVTEGHVRTSILYDAFKAEGDKRRVARLFEVPLRSVEMAVRFEERLAA